MTLPHHHSDLTRCQALLGQLNDYLDGNLAGEICRALEAHMAGCHDCQIVFDTLGKTVRLYHTLGAAPDALPADVEERLLQSVQEAWKSTHR